jgi:hypothetical protein
MKKKSFKCFTQNYCKITANKLLQQLTQHQHLHTNRYCLHPQQKKKESSSHNTKFSPLQEPSARQSKKYDLKVERELNVLLKSNIAPFLHARFSPSMSSLPFAAVKINLKLYTANFLL